MLSAVVVASPSFAIVDDGGVPSSTSGGDPTPSSTSGRSIVSGWAAEPPTHEKIASTTDAVAPRPEHIGGVGFLRWALSASVAPGLPWTRFSHGGTYTSTDQCGCVARAVQTDPDEFPPGIRTPLPPSPDRACGRQLRPPGLVAGVVGSGRWTRPELPTPHVEGCPCEGLARFCGTAGRNPARKRCTRTVGPPTPTIQPTLWWLFVERVGLVGLLGQGLPTLPSHPRNPGSPGSVRCGRTSNRAPQVHAFTQDEIRQLSAVCSITTDIVYARARKNTFIIISACLVER